MTNAVIFVAAFAIMFTIVALLRRQAEALERLAPRPKPIGPVTRPGLLLAIALAAVGILTAVLAIVFSSV